MQSCFLYGKIKPIQKRKVVRDMEEKILQKLDSMQNSIQTQMSGMQTQIDGIQRQINGIEIRIDGIQSQIDGMQSQMDGMQVQINDMQTQMNKRFEEMDQDITEIRQQQFAFEEIYGRKIDAIFDCVTMQMQRNQKHSEKMHELSGRMDRNEITMLDYDRRITILERKR